MDDQDALVQQKFADLGAALAEGTLGAEPEGQADLASRGRLWFESMREVIKSRVCRPEVFKLLRQLESDRAMRVKKISDVLITVIANVPVILVAEIIVDIGMDSLCPGWKDISEI